MTPLIGAGLGAGAGLLASLFQDNEPSAAEQQLQQQAQSDYTWGRGVSDKGLGYIDQGLQGYDAGAQRQADVLRQSAAGLDPRFNDYASQMQQAGQGLWDASRTAGGYGQDALRTFRNQGLNTNLGVANLGAAGLASYSPDDMRAMGLDDGAIRAATMMQGRAGEAANTARLSQLATQSAQAQVGAREASRYGGRAGAARFADMMMHPGMQAGQVQASNTGRTNAYNQFAGAAQNAWGNVYPLGQQGLSAVSQGAALGGQAAQMPWQVAQADMARGTYRANAENPLLTAAAMRTSAGQGLANFGAGQSQAATGLQYKQAAAQADREVGWLPMVLGGAQAGAQLAKGFA